MTSETQPFWKDPVVHFMAFGLATSCTALLLIEYVMLDYVFPAIMPVLVHYTTLLMTAPVDTVANFLPGVSSAPTLLGSVMILFTIALMGTTIAAAACLVVLTSPFIVSYAFWRHLVYERLYKPYITRGDLQ